MKRYRIYLSGPITLGDPDHNLRQAVLMHRELMLAGFSVLNPMLTMVLPWDKEISHRDWIDLDLPWVECADAIFRLPGDSMGADEEVEHAKQYSIPIFTDVQALVEHFKGDEI